MSIDLQILIVGGTGHLGRAIRAISDAHVICVPRSTLDLSSGYDNVRRAVDMLARTIFPSVIVNCAAQTDVTRCEADPASAFAVNVAGATDLARACRRSGLDLVHVSSDYVFGGGADGPHNPNDTPAPCNVYGWSKAAGEIGVRAHGGVVARVSFLPEDLDYRWVARGVRCTKEWSTDTAHRLFRLVRVGRLSSFSGEVLHLVGPETTLEALVASRFPSIPAIDYDVAQARLPYRLPRDVRLGGAW